MSAQRKYASNAERQAAYRSRLAVRAGAELSNEQQPIPSRPGYHRWDLMLREARMLTERIVSEMRDYYEARSESWQCSEHGDGFQGKLDSLEEVHNLLADLPSTRPEA